MFALLTGYRDPPAGVQVNLILCQLYLRHLQLLLAMCIALNSFTNNKDALACGLNHLCHRDTYFTLTHDIDIKFDTVVTL